jgi:hypothetical protein
MADCRPQGLCAYRIARGDAALRACWLLQGRGSRWPVLNHALPTLPAISRKDSCHEPAGRPPVTPDARRAQASSPASPTTAAAPAPQRRQKRDRRRRRRSWRGGCIPRRGSTASARPPRRRLHRKSPGPSAAPSPCGASRPARGCSPRPRPRTTHPKSPTPSPPAAAACRAAQRIAQPHDASTPLAARPLIKRARAGSATADARTGLLPFLRRRPPVPLLSFVIERRILHSGRWAGQRFLRHSMLQYRAMHLAHYPSAFRVRACGPCQWQGLHAGRTARRGDAYLRTAALSSAWAACRAALPVCRAAPRASTSRTVATKFHGTYLPRVRRTRLRIGD